MPATAVRPEWRPAVTANDHVGTRGRAPHGLNRAGSGQRGGGLRYAALRFGQDDQLMPRQLGAYLLGGQLAAHQSADERGDGIGIAAELDRAHQPAAQRRGPGRALQHRGHRVVRIQADPVGGRFPRSRGHLGQHLG